jgi:hypothetical protein
MPRSTPKPKNDTSCRIPRRGGLPLKTNAYGPPVLSVARYRDGAALVVQSGPVHGLTRLGGADLPAIRGAILVVLAQLFAPGEKPGLDARLGRGAGSPPADFDEPLLALEKCIGALRISDNGRGVRLEFFSVGGNWPSVHMTPLN